MPDATFDDDAIRAELRKIVERDRSKLLEKLAAAEESVGREAKATSVGEDVMQRMRLEFDAATSDAMRTYQSMLEYIDRSR